MEKFAIGLYIMIALIAAVILIYLIIKRVNEKDDFEHRDY